ncbi:ORF1 [Anelloviridae sp.]|nr:ORF1 [Anelloviridae sp.]
MPFWWRRRRRFWTNQRFRYKRKRRYTRRYNRRTRRRRYNRRTLRRRRRKPRKVRRKKKQIVVKQWQPDSISKCKIIGYSALVVGAEGKQMFCYTTNKNIAVPPKSPYGGGFGVEQYDLKYLYEEYQFHNNYWTKSNILKDLCRYLYVKLIFYRDNKTDFIFSYDRNPPFNLTKYTYPGTHPQQMLLQKHHKLILSQMTKNPNKLTKTFKIKPPRQMISKWFFQKPFSKYPLLSIKASALDLRHSYLGCCNENSQVYFYYLNHGYYRNTNWGQYSTNAYLPNNTLTSATTVYYKDSKGNTKTVGPFSSKTPYDDSVSYTKGFFQPSFLQTQFICTEQSCAVQQGSVPVNVAIYNPMADSGNGNSVYLVSVLSNTWDQPPSDSAILIQGLPLWLAFYGYLDYVRQIKKDKTWLESHVLVFKSPAVFTFPQPGADKWYCPLSKTFIDGVGPYRTDLTKKQKERYYPQIQHQHEILNSFVEAGPFVPKYNNQSESNWELKFKYIFHFKWGGPQLHEPDIANPTTQDQYDVPDTLQQAVQIENPERQDPRSIIHEWDYRRGFIKERALKRMSTYLSTPSDIQQSPEQTPKKKKRIGPQLTVPQEKDQETLSCLLSLCKEDTFQETQTQENIQQLIEYQQQQQHQLKRDILHLLMKIKENQQMLQLHTGIIP